VGSGDLEVLLEPCAGSRGHVRIRTSVKGFKQTWKEVVNRFLLNYGRAAKIEINDSGATPGRAILRLAQAVEISEQ
jgi:malonate decarboxylase delta subunit